MAVEKGTKAVISANFSAYGKRRFNNLRANFVREILRKEFFNTHGICQQSSTEQWHNCAAPEVAMRFVTTILATVFAATQSAAAQSAATDAESHFEKATTLHQKSDVEAEIAELREAIRLKPAFAEAHLNLGLALFKRREKDAAINEYREAIRLKPDLPEAHLALGIALGWKGDPNGAIAEYREATRLKPDYEEAHRNLGYELMSLGKRQEGLDELERAHALKPEVSRAVVSSPFRVCSDKNPPPCATPPRVIKSPDPKYSKEARKQNIEGITVLWLIVGADGLPRDIRVVRSVGYGLDEEAIRAAKKWRFKPSTMDGKPVPMQINIDVDFHLH